MTTIITNGHVTQKIVTGQNKNSLDKKGLSRNKKLVRYITNCHVSKIFSKKKLSRDQKKLNLSVTEKLQNVNCNVPKKLVCHDNYMVWQMMERQLYVLLTVSLRYVSFISWKLCNKTNTRHVRILQCKQSVRGIIGKATVNDKSSVVTLPVWTQLLLAV